MMEPMEFCDKHQLPLDRKGECELCRLSEMPSNAPASRSAWWAVIIPIVLVLAGIAWAMSLVGPAPGDAPPRGVRTTTPQPASPPPTREEPPPSEPVDVPEPPPVPSRETLAPEPGSEGTTLEQPSLEPETTNENQIPDWKWNVARRRVTVTMYATQWCGVCRKARQYMEAHRIEFIELDTDESAAAKERLGELNPHRTVPTFEIDGLVHVGFRENLFEAQLNQAARRHL
jgi:glutaredoxin